MKRPAPLTADQRDAYEERAAILEYDAHMPRVEAERRAREEVEKKQHKQQNNVQRLNI